MQKGQLNCVTNTNLIVEHKWDGQGQTNWQMEKT